MSLLSCLPHKVIRVQQFHLRDDDDVGEIVDDEPSIESDPIACEIQNQSRSEIQEWDKRAGNLRQYVFFNQDVCLEEDDRLEVTVHPHLAGKELKVIAYEDRSAGRGKVFGAICEVER